MNAVLVLRFMRKHELDLVIFFVYGVVPLYLYGPKRTSIAPHSIAQLQRISSKSNGYKHHNRGQGFLPDLQIDLPIRDSTLTFLSKKNPSHPKARRATHSNFRLAFGLLGRRVQNAEAVSAIRPHQH